MKKCWVTTNGQINCVDTSFFINSWVRDYPPNNPFFKIIWEYVDTHIRAGNIVVCEQVYKEIAKKEDSLFAWLENYKDLVFSTNEQLTAAMRQLMKLQPNFAAIPGRNVADPWVICVAQVVSGIVVTAETREATRATKPPKIPNVCEELGIEWLRPVDFIARLHPDYERT